MTVVINLNDSNPDTCCSYEDHATLLNAGSNAWDDFFGHYPVMMVDGRETIKLNPNNYAYDINGNAVDIINGTQGDVMIAFPRRGLRITTTSDNLVRISFTNISDDSNFRYLAHQHEGKDLNTFYTGAYDGWIDSDGKLRSLSGKLPTVSQTIGAFRTAAQLNGEGYEQFAFYQLLYLQCMFIMKYKTLNGQTALGRGRVDYTDSTDTANQKPALTGTLDSKGLDWGDQTGTSCMKFAGIENFWGSIWKWVDGCVTDNAWNYLTTTGTFNDNGSGYEFIHATDLTQNTGVSLKFPQGTTEGGFTIKAGGGSTTTYFSDKSYCYTSSVADFGGDWDSTSSAGPFYLYLIYSASVTGASIGGRVQRL